MSFIQDTWSKIGNEMGVFPLPLIKKRAPISSDSNYNLMQLWLNSVTLDVWVLVKKEATTGSTIATWVMFSAGGGDLTSLTDNMGTIVTPIANNIDLTGIGLLTTAGTDPGFMEIHLEQGNDGEIIIAKTGQESEYGTLTSTAGSIVITPDVSTPGSFTINLDTVGGIATSSYIVPAGTSPVFPDATGALTLTSTGGTVTITGGVNTINLEAGAAVPTTFTTDAGSATPALNILTVSGGANINTSAAGSTVTINLDANVDTTSYSTLAGSPTEAIDIQANQISAGGSDTDVDIDITPKGAGNVTIQSGTLQVASFGLGAVLSDSFGQTSSSNGTDGQLLIAGTGLIPAWANLTSTDGSVVITPGPNTLNIQTSTAALIQRATTTLTSAEVKALHTTPIEVIPAPGVGKKISVVNITTVMNYGGTNPFTGGGQFQLRYTDQTGLIIVAGTTMDLGEITSSFDTFQNQDLLAASKGALADAENQPVVVFNSISAFTGNAADDNTVTFNILYSVVDV